MKNAKAVARVHTHTHTHTDSLNNIKEINKKDRNIMRVSKLDTC